ncbi:dihydroneopterin triphosphate diphosphatase [Ferrovum myxofaciens]|uniref:Dihydroneopterin triphosphate diphosphatase n=2 Tax=root TaxID=1 RepID=A0A859A9Z8_9PROT|nr:dihydroneopterin triphosphate diphosphatase [Ferrovum myxofaciens]MBW8028541.1 dihydroneopterin triphosphate diphosphatase [Ferrovum sp.]KXW59133.1 dihydroneopterin triphosphate pyrophosphatase [Ferrovum myxofaciens]MBU6995089.1 dihydroneopterin triphosphate diphosphatase [Ferrovum myxofaciens]QKE38882.1 MAG: dihydroneopterin triphosphate diphosphatase [Ferrovum myxofaciens]QKE41468.1 MAG: dihydroneopterin triphosphate diphosphatase [Ferrovum myxofaciens]
MTHKIPESVLVVVYTPAGYVLLIERADAPGYWQSVTGSRNTLEESLWETARREVAEETGLCATPDTLKDWKEARVYEIYPRWRHRYAPGVIQNTEHRFGLVVPEPLSVTLCPREHVRQVWLPWQEAALQCFSWTNQEALRDLPQHMPAPVSVE